jgi:leucyl/phenylalanyl-tRNA--protein transferase
MEWEFPDPRTIPGDLIGIGADLKPATIIAAYERGIFPMPIRSRQLGWWSPERRGILPLDQLRVSRSLRKSCQHFEYTLNRSFDLVIQACMAQRRSGAWISESIEAAYRTLHRQGMAHSVEVWLDGDLVGGLYGVAIGGLFAGESMFHSSRDASKAALCALVQLMSDAPAPAMRLLDVQWKTEHLATLGVIEIDRVEYLDRLEVVRSLPPLDWTPRTLTL